MGLYDPSSFETMHAFCTAYNKAVEKHIASKKKPSTKLDGFPVRCSRSHLKHVLQKCYNKSISDPNLLNHYEAFTPEVSLTKMIIFSVFSLSFLPLLLDLHCPDSSPNAAFVNLVWVRTLALSDTPSTPSGVPDSGRMILGLDQKFLTPEKG